MRFIYTERFRKSFDEAPDLIKKAFAKQAGFLATNLRHPSLKAKKYDEKRDIWQARVTGSWRFYFRIEGDTYVLLDIIPHPK
jgi:mRNA-degrading endonuclease RelE of RelBE toxin-antitoxin system